MLEYKAVEVYVKDMDQNELGLWTGDEEPQKGQTVELDYGTYGDCKTHEAVVVRTWDAYVEEDELEESGRNSFEYGGDVEGQTYFNVY